MGTIPLMFHERISDSSCPRYKDNEACTPGYNTDFICATVVASGISTATYEYVRSRKLLH
jgi:hypothetical protein